MTAVLTIFLRVVEQVLRERSAGAAPKAKLGAVNFVHRLQAGILSAYLLMYFGDQFVMIKFDVG